MSLGRKIRELRIKKGLTQSEVGNGIVTPSMISQIESDKANPSYRVLDAIATKIEVPLEYFLADLQSQSEQSTAYKIAKAHMLSRSFDRAVELLSKVLDNVPLSFNLDVKIDLGHCLMEISRFDDASVALQEAVEDAMSKMQYHHVILALNHLGRLEMLRKKQHMAVYYWRKGYDLFPQLPMPEPFLQGELLNNLGAIHYELGETQDALMYYQEALKFLDDSCDVEQVGATYLGLALSHRQASELDLAYEYASYAVALFESMKNVKLAIDVKRKFVTMMHNGKPNSKALTCLTECLEQCKKYNFTDEAATIYSDIAMLHIQQKNPLLSLETVEEGLAVATAGSLAAATLLRSKGLALGNLDKHSDAIKVLEQAKKLFESHESKSEVAGCYALIAEIHQKAGDVLTANKCLQRMRRVMQESLQDRGFVFSA